MIKAENLTKKFIKYEKKNKKEFLADDNISFEAHDGEIIGILGPNGAGKTTLLRMMAGILELTKGNISFDGLNYKDNEIEIKKNIAYLSGNTKLYDTLSTYELLKMCGDIYGIEIPFTQTKYVYSYDVEIKSGFDFSAISCDINENNKTVSFTMPQPKILSNEIDLDSLKVYHEAESIFTNVSLDENNKALQSLKEQAEQDSIENGLLDNAKANAEELLKNFLSSEYDPEEYSYSFEYTK